MICGFRARFAGGALLLALAVLYAPTASTMAHLWWTYDYAGHGPFVPLFSAVIAWRARHRLRAAAGGGHPAGLAVIILGLGLLGAGSAAQSLLLQGLSAVVVVAGLVVLSCGAAALKAVGFPVAFLLLMVPLPHEVVTAVTLHLQLFAAGFAGSMLAALDIPFHRRGVLIELPDTTLTVAEVCNGLRFLLALLVATLAFAAVSQRGVWRKVLLTAAAMPVAILANAIRVAAIVIAVHYMGPHAAVGTPHYVIGKIVWLGTIAPLIGLALALRRGGAPERPPDPLRVVSGTEGKALVTR
jgi:exosortase